MAYKVKGPVKLGWLVINDFVQYNGLQTDVVLLELSKVFNKVPHDALPSKL